MILMKMTAGARELSVESYIFHSNLISPAAMLGLLVLVDESVSMPELGAEAGSRPACE